MKRLFLSLFPVLSAFSLGSQPCYGFGHTDLNSVLSNLDQHIKHKVQHKLIPGCAVAVVYQGKIVFMNGYGLKSVNKSDPIDVDTVFQLGSVSKPIASTLTSILERKGVLKLDDPVHRYLPNFSLKTRQPSHAFKIRHVLSHSTGVSRAGFNNLIEAHHPYEKILRSLQSTPVRTPMGKRYDYNNAMYSLISHITQSATQTSYREALQNNLLLPLNMTRTTTTLNGLLNTPNKALPHLKDRRGRFIPRPTYSQGYYNVVPAGGINSSVRDMANFLKAQMGGYPELLSSHTLSRIHTAHVHTPTTLNPYEGPPSLIKNARYGLGWRIVDFSQHQLLFHGGWLSGFTNFIAFMPDQKIGIVILHNSEARFSASTAVKFFESFLGVKPHKKPVFAFPRSKAQKAPLKKAVVMTRKIKRVKLKPSTRYSAKPLRKKVK